jgi:AcrR family transcriptional regulator
LSTRIEKLTRWKKRQELTPRKQPIQQRATQTVQDILEAAAQVFSEEGYLATTNRIAERAGVSIGSLYQYFQNKNQILSTLLEQHIQQGYDTIRRELPEIMKPGKITRSTIRRLVEIMIVLHEKNPTLHRILLDQIQLSQFRGAYARNEDLTLGNLTVLLKKTPKARKKHFDGPLKLVVHAVEAMTHRFVLYGYEGIEKEVFIAEVTDMMTRYLLQA